jgi:hypothetical protein
MSEPMLLTLGPPFGVWVDAAPAFLGGAAGKRLFDPALLQWHEQVVGAPLLEVNGTDILAALGRVDVSPQSVAELLQLRPVGSDYWGGADSRLCWTAPALAECLPEARFLIWVEHPACSLARWLATSSDGDPVRALALLESAAQNVMRLLHRYPSRCLAVYTDEASIRPVALVDRLRDWLGLDLAVANLAAATAADPLCLALAEQLVALHPRLQREFERLYASCVPLLDGGDAPRGPRLVDAAAAVVAHRELVRRADSCAALEQQLRASGEAGQRIEAALSAELQQTREEQRTALLKSMEAEQALAAAQQEGDALRDENRQQAQEGELLLVHLHEVQEELEHYYLACRDLEARGRDAMPECAATRIDRVEVGVERDTPPHRELSVILHGVQAADRTLAQLDVRLVEHHERPGVALFAGLDGAQPLMAWSPSGHEDGREYVLLVPTDEASRRTLQCTGTSDWRFIQGVVMHSTRALAERDDAPLRWRIAARRLQRQLADLPPRLRFDGVQAAAEAGSSRSLLVTFVNACFGDRQLGELRLRWHVDTARVELLAPSAADSSPCLGAWPVDNTGMWQPEWHVPLNGQTRPTLEHAWYDLPRADREFLLGLLDALPAAAPHAAVHGAGDAAMLARAAARPLRQAVTLLNGTRLRRALRSLRGRLAP